MHERGGQTDRQTVKETHTEKVSLLVISHAHRGHKHQKP